VSLVRSGKLNIVPVPTPFNDDLQLDLGSFGNHLDFLYGAGIRSLIIGGTTGEGLALSAKEKLDLVEFALAKYPDLELYGCIISFNIDFSSTLAPFVRCISLLVMPPFFVRATKADIISFYSVLVKQCHQQIVLYNNPSRTMVDISSMYEELVAIDNRIMSVKETQFKQLPKIPWYCGEDSQILALKEQFIGVMSVASNVEPLLVEKMLGNFTEQDKTQWTTLLNKLTLGPNPLVVKYLLWKAGIYSTYRSRFPIKLAPDLQIQL
jgi:4-hydroxy-tetrahydrodipicolinate synthase